MSVHHFAMPSGSLLAGNPRWLLLALVSLAGNSLYSKESLTGVRTRATTISGSPNQTTERGANGCGTTVEAEAVATPTGLRTRRRSWIWGVTSPAAPRGIGSLAGKLAVCPCVGFVVGFPVHGGTASSSVGEVYVGADGSVVEFLRWTEVVGEWRSSLGGVLGLR